MHRCVVRSTGFQCGYYSGVGWGERFTAATAGAGVGSCLSLPCLRVFSLHDHELYLVVSIAKHDKKGNAYWVIVIFSSVYTPLALPLSLVPLPSCFGSISVRDFVFPDHWAVDLKPRKFIATSIYFLVLKAALPACLKVSLNLRPFSSVG